MADAEADRITDFIRRRVREAKAEGVVVGISGGVDSALVAKLCVMAVGKEGVHGLLLPCGPQPVEDAKSVVKHLGLPLTRTIQIVGACDDLARWNGAFDRISRGNIQARVRMICLYAWANRYDLLVAGTSNKSELLTGYFTKYGDGGVDFEPIAHLYKTEVWDLARRLQLPGEIIKKAPSAGLWEGQTDEGELGISYERLDRLLDFLDIGNPEYYLNHLDTLSLSTKTTEEECRKVINLMVKARHKLKMPPML